MTDVDIRGAYPTYVEATPIESERPFPNGKPCSQCGCPYDVDSRFCPACGHAGDSRDPLAPADSDNASWESRTMECTSCGSQLTVDRHQRSYTCPFCESNVVVELPPRPGRDDPDFIIGFAVTPQNAAETFRKWIGTNNWLRPGDLSDATLTDRLRGVYLPFWSFSMLAQSAWSAHIGEYWYRTETYTITDKDGKTRTATRTVRETEWWPLRGRHHRYYHGYLVSGSRGLSQDEANAIKPFHLAALHRYQPYFLAGWSCEEYSVDRAHALDITNEYVARRERAHVGEFLPGDTYRGLELSVERDHVHADLLLLPVYLLSYHYRHRTYRFLINGQTGKIVGDKPYSAVRIGMLVVAILFVLVSLFALLQLR